MPINPNIILQAGRGINDGVNNYLGIQQNKRQNRLAELDQQLKQAQLEGIKNPAPSYTLKPIGVDDERMQLAAINETNPSQYSLIGNPYKKSSGVTVQNNLGNTRNEELIKEDIKNIYTPAQEASKTAAEDIKEFNIMERTLDKHMEQNPSLTAPGPAFNARLGAAKVLDAIPFVDIAGVETAQELNRQVSDKTVRQLEHMKGNPSDKDMQKVVESVQNADQTVGGFRLGIQVGKAAAKWNREYNSRLASWVRQGKDPAKFDDHFENIKTKDPRLKALAKEVDSVFERAVESTPQGNKRQVGRFVIEEE